MTGSESIEDRRLCADCACTGVLNADGKCAVCGLDAHAGRRNPFVDSGDDAEYTRKPCGKKADWVLIGDVLDGGSGFVAVCRDCYKRGLQKVRPATPNELVDPWVFKDELGREPMCGDDDDSSALWEALHSATELVPEAPINDRQFARWVRLRDLRAHVHRIAVERRLKRMESQISILISVGSIAAAAFAADRVTKAVGLTEGWPRWLAFAVITLSAYEILNRLLLMGRLRKYVKIK